MTMPSDESRENAPIVIERRGAVETLVINDAPRNRMSLEFMDQLEQRVAELREDRRLRALVIRGAGEEHNSRGMVL
jgi:enoyl-CoA hydratase/carnithine racemase